MPLAASHGLMSNMNKNMSISARIKKISSHRTWHTMLRGTDPALARCAAAARSMPRSLRSPDRLSPRRSPVPKMGAPPLHARASATAVVRQVQDSNMLRPHRAKAMFATSNASPTSLHVVDVAYGSFSTGEQPSAEASPFFTRRSGPRDFLVSPVPSFSLFCCSLS